LTDGFVSDAFVAQTAVVSRGEKVAKALTAPDVRLWHRVKGGYKIHDFFDWNGKSKDIKEKRRDEASRVKHYRATKRSKRS
jgi:hypothetical protein